MILTLGYQLFELMNLDDLLALFPIIRHLIHEVTGFFLNSEGPSREENLPSSCMASKHVAHKLLYTLV